MAYYLSWGHEMGLEIPKEFVEQKGTEILEKHGFQVVPDRGGIMNRRMGLEPMAKYPFDSVVNAIKLMSKAAGKTKELDLRISIAKDMPIELELRASHETIARVRIAPRIE